MSTISALRSAACPTSPTAPAPARAAHGAGDPGPGQRLGRGLGPGGRGHRRRGGPGDRQSLDRRDVRLRGRREHPAQPAPGHGRPDRGGRGPAGDDGLRGRLRRRRGDRPPGDRDRRRRRQPRGPDEAARPRRSPPSRRCSGPAGTPGSTSCSTPAPTPSWPSLRGPTAARHRAGGELGVVARGDPPGRGLPRCRRSPVVFVPGGVAPRRDRGARRCLGPQAAQRDQRPGKSLPVRELQELGVAARLDRTLHPAGRGPDRAAGATVATPRPGRPLPGRPAALN